MGDPGTVGGGQVPGERGQGPAVPGDVVDHQGEDMGVVTGAEQLRADGDVGREVERAAGGSGQRRRQIGLVGHVPHVRGQLDRVAPLGAVDVQDPLVRFVVDLGEHRAQGLVPADHVVERGLQRLDVERTGQPEGERHVVRR